VEVSQPDDVTFHTPDGGLADPVPYPLWLLIVTCLVPLAIAVAVVIITVRIGREPSPAGAGTAPAPTAPTEEFVQVEDLFPLQNATPPPVQYPTDTPTQVLPPTQGAFTELITPSEPARTPPAAPPPAAPTDTPTEKWSLSQDSEPNPDEPHPR